MSNSELYNARLNMYADFSHMARVVMFTCGIIGIYFALRLTEEGH